jgi:hypothetical protein
MSPRHKSNSVSLNKNSCPWLAANCKDGTKLGFKSYSILNDGWVMIDLGSKYTINNIKIQDLTEGEVVTPAKGLVLACH